ncbi:hypothetical protein GPEL0_01f4535 [Geoanaerobacter pelophilus]|uniref:Transposase n=1 Tax=Geoanaerobacter pelophilus TaxID=60036 RepID=A0ABQ0MMH0_9BACT|nr:hypothetical protein GPEL0_01f4535 [Geoanaerobacter pelophilus]
MRFSQIHGVTHYFVFLIYGKKVELLAVELVVPRAIFT